MKTRVGLVGELVRLAERFWGSGHVEAATLIEATQMDALLIQVYADNIRLDARDHKAELVALVADGTGDERRRTISISSPFDVDEVQTADGDAAEPPVEVRSALEDGQAFVLRRMFALEFAKLTFEFFRPCAGGGCVGFECRDFAAAKERAEALQRLAARVDGLENGEDVGGVHDAIVAYSAELGGRNSARATMNFDDQKSYYKSHVHSMNTATTRTAKG